MATGDDPKRWVSEDEILLADGEGVESAHAAVALGRAKRRETALERRGQLDRICQVFGLGDDDPYDDVRIRVLYRVIGYVHEQVWREALDEVRRQVLDDDRRESREWRSEMLNADRVHSATFNDAAVFLPDGRAIAGMTQRREQAMARANEYLESERLGMVAVEQCTYPNPYQDLWVVDPVDPDHRVERREGGFLVVVPAAGDVHQAGSGVTPRPAEMVGMIGPPNDEWD
jgi:hypothetical protein